MKHYYISLLTIALLSLLSFKGYAQDEDEWTGIGTGAYQPGILDCYNDEYADVMPAAVYESTTTPGKYKFVPTPPAEGLRMVYDIVVHTENPDKIWCEDAHFFWGIMNLSTRHQVLEAGDSDHPENYGHLEDGVISFPTPGSFRVNTFSGPLTSNLNGKFALYLPGSQIPGTDPIVNDTWEVLGTGKYTEGFLDCEYEAGKTWDVEIEKSVEHPGCYRFKPYPSGNPSCPNLPEIADVYVYVHAENPIEVYTSDFTLLNNQGKGYKICHRAVLESGADYSYYGTIEDNVFTFPANSHIATIIGIPGMGSMYTNMEGKATISLPNADYGDYYIKAVHPACATSAGDGFCNFPFRIEAGTDVNAAGIVVEPGCLTAEEIDVNSYMSGEIQVFPKDFFNFDLNMTFPMVADQFGTNRWTMILIALDENQQPRGFSISTYFTPQDNKEWQPYYKAEMTDIILSPSYFDASATYEVVVEQNKKKPGFLRVVDPFNNHPSIKGNSEYVAGHTTHKHYLYLHAEDPDYVYIEEAPAGINLGYGDLVASSAVGALLNKKKTLSEIKSLGVPAGRLSDKDIIFSPEALNYFETDFRSLVLQSCGDGLLLRLTEPSSVNNIIEDAEGEAVYYNLQGLRVDSPQKGAIYIKVENGRTTKIIN